MLGGASMAMAQDATTSPSPSTSPVASQTSRTATAENVVVTSEELDVSREQIVPSLGATRYTVGPDRLGQQAQGEDAPFNQTILRFPGMAQDSFGQLHLRGEHANLQYRLDDVLLPEGITGFGQELETRFADNISLITGALPAQFGFRTTGVVDIHTKSGAVFTGGEASLHVGSFDTIMPSFELAVLAASSPTTVPPAIYTAALVSKIRREAAMRFTMTPINSRASVISPTSSMTPAV